jgi:hypothetical protein
VLLAIHVVAMVIVKQIRQMLPKVDAFVQQVTKERIVANKFAKMPVILIKNKVFVTAGYVHVYAKKVLLVRVASRKIVVERSANVVLQD